MIKRRTRRQDPPPVGNRIEPDRMYVDGISREIVGDVDADTPLFPRPKFKPTFPAQTGDLISDGKVTYLVIDTPGLCITVDPPGLVFKIPPPGHYENKGTVAENETVFRSVSQRIYNDFSNVLENVLESEGVSGFVRRFKLRTAILKNLKFITDKI